MAWWHQDNNFAPDINASEYNALPTFRSLNTVPSQYASHWPTPYIEWTGPPRLLPWHHLYLCPTYLTNLLKYWQTQKHRRFVEPKSKFSLPFWTLNLRLWKTNCRSYKYPNLFLNPFPQSQASLVRDVKLSWLLKVNMILEKNLNFLSFKWENDIVCPL